MEKEELNPEIGKILMKAQGELASNDEKTFKEIVEKLIEVWDIKRAPEVMLVNRMTATWMKMRRVESMLGKSDLYFENIDESGKVISVKINELANYLSRLDAEFRSYYRVLNNRKTMAEPQSDFHDFLKVKNGK